jgi:hypothetical protein
MLKVDVARNVRAEGLSGLICTFYRMSGSNVRLVRDPVIIARPSMCVIEGRALLTYLK